MSPPQCEGPGHTGLQAEAPTDLHSNLIPLPLPACVTLSRPLSLGLLIYETGMTVRFPQCKAPPAPGSNMMPCGKYLGVGLIQGPPNDSAAEQSGQQPGLPGSKPGFAAASSETARQPLTLSAP